MARKVKRKDLKYETKKYIYNFHQHETIRYFGDTLYTSKTDIDEAVLDQKHHLKIL